MKARTIVEINGPALPAPIPAGTLFTIKHRGDKWSSCTGLGVTLIWNDEYALVP